MENVFDVNVSVYNGVFDRCGQVCKLSYFLNDKKHIQAIEYLRTIEDKSARNELKKRLPQCTISGVFAPTRAANNLKEHSGLICIDIDRADNNEIDNWNELKAELSKLPQIAYIGLSVSGNGYFAIIPLAFPDWHQMQFEQLKRDFAEMGLIIDKSCGDVCRLRCLSHDAEPYINEHATPYQGCYIEPRPVPTYNYHWDDGDMMERVGKCCQTIAVNGIDLTANYSSWVTIGMALASLGEQGRQFFHICSSQNQGYHYEECDRKFTQLLRSCRRVGIGTFFKMCKQYSVLYK